MQERHYRTGLRVLRDLGLVVAHPEKVFMVTEHGVRRGYVRLRLRLDRAAWTSATVRDGNYRQSTGRAERRQVTKRIRATRGVQTITRPSGFTPLASDSTAPSVPTNTHDDLSVQQPSPRTTEPTKDEPSASFALPVSIQKRKNLQTALGADLLARVETALGAIEEPRRSEMSERLAQGVIPAFLATGATRDDYAARAEECTQNLSGTTLIKAVLDFIHA